MTGHWTTPLRDETWTVLHTRGKGCAHLAELISEGTATRVEGDLKTAVIAARADALVTARAGSFDLTSTLVPHSVDEDRAIPAVIGAVGTGPHSPLVAATTHRLARGLGADAMLVTMSSNSDDDPAAEEVLSQLAAHAPDAATKLVRADHPAVLLESLPDDGLVVLGAPGGSWWQRQFFGPGRRLIHAAPAGSIVVRAAPRRCFHAMTEVTAFGPLMRAADAATIVSEPVAPVVENGILIGQVWRDALAGAAPDCPVGDLAEGPVSVTADELLEVASDVADRLGGAPVPVVDGDQRLLGAIPT